MRSTSRKAAFLAAAFFLAGVMPATSSSSSFSPSLARANMPLTTGHHLFRPYKTISRSNRAVETEGRAYNGVMGLVGHQKLFSRSQGDLRTRQVKINEPS